MAVYNNSAGTICSLDAVWNGPFARRSAVEEDSSDGDEDDGENDDYGDSSLNEIFADNNDNNENSNAGKSNKCSRGGENL